MVPTHHELISIREQLDVARKGEHVLERRRDGLVFVLLDLIDRWRVLQSRLDEQFREANELHVTAMEREGDIGLRELANVRATRPELIVGETKLLGMDIPRILSAYITTPVVERGYGVVGTSALDDELVSSYEALLELVVRIAEIRAVLSQLLAEVRRLRIRVNYLTHRLIPDLESDRDYVQRYLAEREREERYRQLRVKRLREKRKDQHRR
ncbi:V-type ATP synthase subunit D [Salinigranum salinum]|uniref:V-type ATP synthase subunit D n=1 Tax=Salinigranum salinum TaxID=1364937 RepID=UPI001F04237F|nr:V-type ATP synthase subunit D [Salinigranum salinum]